MTEKEIITELTDIALIMAQLGDLNKATVIREAIKLIDKKNAAFVVDEFDVLLAESMFTKRELAQMYVKKLTELEALRSNDTIHSV